MSGVRILVVEDEPDIREILQVCLQREGYAVTLSRNLAEALAELREHRCDLVLTDNCLPDGRGVDLIRALHEPDDLPPLPAILMSAGPLPHDKDSVPPCVMLDKPFALGELLQILRSLFVIPARTATPS